MVKLISIVCPMFNEGVSIEPFFSRLIKSLQVVSAEYELVCVNDGSTDNTLELLINKKSSVPSLRIINLSRNFGKEAALSAGLNAAKGDVIIPIDADLQDPPELIKEMLAKHEEGYDVVLARRVNRRSDSFFKRWTAKLFYKLIGKISDISIPNNVGDYRLISRRVLDELNKLSETQRFMKGLFSWVGFSTTYVDYVRPKREKGAGHFSIWSLWNLAWEGVTSFSTVPLKMWTYIGSLVSMISFIYGTWIVFKTLWLGVDVPGYASLVTIFLFIGGVQLIGIGIVGEYVGRIYLESKRRPVYIVESEL